MDRSLELDPDGSPTKKEIGTTAGDRRRLRREGIRTRCHRAFIIGGLA